MSDIFISYAHVDDQILIDGEKSWITYFTNHLRSELSRKIGREDNYSFWKDFRLRGNYDIEQEIRNQIKTSKVLLIYLSTGWLKSEWCRRELELYIDTHINLDNSIFVIELEYINREDKPNIIQNLLGYSFWYKNDQEKIRQLGYPIPQKTDREYFNILNSLSSRLLAKVRKFSDNQPHKL